MGSLEQQQLNYTVVDLRGKVKAHVNDEDHRVYLDDGAWDGTKDGLSKLGIVGFEDPDIDYQTLINKQYEYYNPTQANNYKGQYLIPSEAYNYENAVINGKFWQDFNYYWHGGNWYSVGTRFSQIVWRDLTAKDNLGTVIEAACYAIPVGFKEIRGLGRLHGQKVFKYKGKYYSRDVDAHNGGVWKVFEMHNGKLKRIGTTDSNLTILKK